MPLPLDNLLVFYINTYKSQEYCLKFSLPKLIILQQGREVNLLHHSYCITKNLIVFAADGR